MSIIKKSQFFPGKSWLNILFILLISGVLIGLPPFFESNTQPEADLAEEVLIFPEKPSETSPKLLTLQDNTLFSVLNPSNPEPEVVQKIKVVVTGYSSTVDQTDLDPFITAAGTRVKEGIIANNFLPFGTKVKIPELYGDRVFVVEDRMNWKKGYYHVDIWFASYWEAKNFGAKRTYIEILES